LRLALVWGLAVIWGDCVLPGFAMPYAIFATMVGSWRLKSTCHTAGWRGWRRHIAMQCAVSHGRYSGCNLLSKPSCSLGDVLLIIGPALAIGMTVSCPFCRQARS